VVALKLKDGKEPTSSDSYENSELVTYAEARKSTNPKPYIAAVLASSGVDEKLLHPAELTKFILGDGRNTSDQTSRRRRSTSSDYYNGPLEPGTSYSIFQRIVLNDKVWYMLVITLQKLSFRLV
jgi:hypothetical protein